MRLPSGTRICLLAVFGFLMLTLEFPELSQFMPTSNGDSDGSILIGNSDVNAYYGQQSVPKSKILVSAWGHGGWGGYGGYGGWGRRWGYGGYYGGWGRPYWGGYGGGYYGGWKRGWGWG